MNDHGLNRFIDEAAKREIRQACFYGCVVCGKLPYTYEHFDPPFVDATEHDPKGMALLCANHQSDRTAGRLCVADVRRAKSDPHNKQRDAIWPSHFSSPNLVLDLFGNIVHGPAVGLAINEQVVFGMKAPEQDGQPWFFTGSFCDKDGKETLRFVDNEIVINRGNWDVTLEGRDLIVRNGPGSIVAQVSFVPEQNRIVFSRLEMRLANDHYLKGSSKGISVFGPEVQLEINGISGSYGTGSAYSYGPASTGSFSTIAINAPRLGTFGDWKAGS